MQPPEAQAQPETPNPLHNTTTPFIRKEISRKTVFINSGKGGILQFFAPD